MPFDFSSDLSLLASGLHARCSCDGQAQRRAALAVELRVSDCGSGRSGDIGEAADIALSDQPSVTVTIQLFTQLAVGHRSSQRLIENSSPAFPTAARSLPRVRCTYRLLLA